MTDARVVTFSPGTPGAWRSDVSEVDAALDELSTGRVQTATAAQTLREVAVVTATGGPYVIGGNGAAVLLATTGAMTGLVGLTTVAATATIAGGVDSGGAGHDLIVRGGDGSAIFDDGGDLTLRAGDAGAGANHGKLALQNGSGTDVLTIPGTALPDVSLNAHDLRDVAQVHGATTADLVITAATATTTGDAKSLDLRGGDVDANNQTAGDASLRAGDAGGADGIGGDLTLRGGNGTTDGSVYLTTATGGNAAGVPGGSSKLTLYADLDANGQYLEDCESFLFYRKTSDTSRTSATALADDPHMASQTLPANTTWIVEGACDVNAGSGVPDLQISFTWPTGATGRIMVLANQGTTAREGDSVRTSGQNTGLIACGSGARTILLFKGTVALGGTAGPIDFQWAQRASSTDATTVYTGSYMMLTRADL